VLRLDSVNGDILLRRTPSLFVDLDKRFFLTEYSAISFVLRVDTQGGDTRMDLTHNYTAPRGKHVLAKGAAQMLAF
jgi:hypothetical protein